MAASARDCVQDSQTHITAFKLQNAEFDEAKADMMKHFALMQARVDTAEKYASALERRDIEPKAAKILEDRDEEIRLLKAALREAKKECASHARRSREMAQHAAAMARDSLQHFSDYRTHTHELFSLHNQDSALARQLDATEICIERCRNDITTALKRLGVKSHYVILPQFEGSDHGIVIEKGTDFGFGGAVVASVTPGSAACATGGIRSGDCIIGVGDR